MKGNHCTGSKKRWRWSMRKPHPAPVQRMLNSKLPPMPKMLSRRPLIRCSWIWGWQQEAHNCLSKCFWTGIPQWRSICRFWNQRIKLQISVKIWCDVSALFQNQFFEWGWPKEYFFVIRGSGTKESKISLGSLDVVSCLHEVYCFFVLKMDCPKISLMDMWNRHPWKFYCTWTTNTSPWEPKQCVPHHLEEWAPFGSHCEVHGWT